MVRDSPVHGVFRCEGEIRTIAYGGAMCRLRDSVGLHHIARPLRRPGQSIPATELMQAGRRTSGAGEGHPVPEAQQALATCEASERARVAATRAIRAAMQRIAVHNPQLGEHLAAAIRTGSDTTSMLPDGRRAG